MKTIMMMIMMMIIIIIIIIITLGMNSDATGKSFLNV